MDFYNQQQQNLDRLINGLTDTEKSYYKARLDKLQRDINVKKEALKLPSTVEGKKEVNTKRKELLGDKLLDVEKVEEIKKAFDKKDLSGLINHHHANVFNVVNKAVKANTKTVSPETAEKAILTRASTVFKRSGKAQAEGYLNSHGFDNYEILPESTGEGLVLRNKSTGKVKVAFRGTLLPQELKEVPTSIGDIGTDLSFMTGFEDQTGQFQEADELVKNVKAKYGGSFDELLGFSLGGGKALSLGDKYGIDTTTFNPLVGKNHVQAQETSATHNINRTTEDMPSLGVGLIDRENVKVKSYYPLKSNVFNVKRHHDLENFIQRGRPRHTESHIENLMNETMKQGAKLGEHQTLASMLDYVDEVEAKRPPLPRFGQVMTPEEKARFDAFKEPSFTEWAHRFNSGGNGVDTNSAGELLPSVRMTDKTIHGKLWKAIGEDFSPEEMDIFRQSSKQPSDPNLSKDEINRLVNTDAEGRDMLFKEHFNNLENVNNQLNEATNAEEIMPLRNSGQSVGFGASTGVGLLSGLASEGLISTGERIFGTKIDDSKDIRTGVVGGLSGYLATQGIGMLAGETLGAPELAVGTGIGALSSVAGKEAGKLAQKAGASKFAQTETSGATGGAVAGFGTALGAGALAGAEAGVPLDAETLGMASLVGAGIGAGFSAIGYSLGKIGINI